MENKEMPLQSADQPKDIWPKIIVGGAVIFFCACMIVGAVFLSRYARPYLDSTAIVLEPDYSKVSEIDRPVLEETARILTERCDFMGCNSVTFTVSENDQIIGKIPFYLNLNIESIAREITTIGLLEFTGFGKTPVAEGTTVTTDFKNPFSAQVDQKARHTIMTNTEIESATVSTDQTGRFVINFTLTEKGAKILTEYTSENVGSYLGIILDKVVLSMPLVNSPIIGGQGQITGNFDDESARNLAAYLNIIPLPIPLIVTEIR